jgi:hypothetical protein
MESINQSQYNNLLNGKLDSTLPDHVISDIQYTKTILLSKQNNNYFVEYVELDELCQEELSEMSHHGSLITIS